MLALADPPTETAPIHGLKYNAEWHRQQEAKERAWLDNYARVRRMLPMGD